MQNFFINIGKFFRCFLQIYFYEQFFSFFFWYHYSTIYWAYIFVTLTNSINVLHDNITTFPSCSSAGTFLSGCISSNHSGFSFKFICTTSALQLITAIFYSNNIFKKKLIWFHCKICLNDIDVNNEAIKLILYGMKTCANTGYSKDLAELPSPFRCELFATEFW